MVSVACLVSLSINYSASKAQTVTTGQLDPTQVYTTGNMVQPTTQGSGTTPWVNGVYQDNLTCWAWGDPGYCGPNPIVRPGGSINFSFGLTNLHQIQSIASALPNSGTSLRINGYNFSFTAKNGNGWDNGGLDTLSAYVNFYDTKGNTVFNKNYDLNYQFNWASFNYSENFLTPYAAKELNTVQYGFVGRDNNNWAGPYGPEVYNVNFNVKYSVDPCAINVLSSPSCPGYLDELAKLSSPSTTSLADISTTPTTLTTITNDISQPVPIVNSEPVSTANVSQQVPLAISTSTKTSTPSSLIPSAVIQPNDKSVSSPSLSSVLNIVRSEQTRIAAVEKNTVQQAIEEVTKIEQNAQQQAEQTAAALTSMSIDSADRSNLKTSAPDQQNTISPLSTLSSLLPGSSSVVNILQGGTKKEEKTIESTASLSNEVIIQPMPRSTENKLKEVVQVPLIVLPLPPANITPIIPQNNVSAQPVTPRNAPIPNIIQTAVTNTFQVPILLSNSKALQEEPQNTAPVQPVTPRNAPTPNIIQTAVTNTFQVPVVLVSNSKALKEEPQNTSPVLLSPPVLGRQLPVVDTSLQSLLVSSIPAITTTFPLTISSAPTYSLEPAPLPTQFSRQEIKNLEIEIPVTNDIKTDDKNIILDQAKPSAAIQPDTQASLTGPSVNNKVSDNDAAGGVSLVSIAKQPPGFELYMAALKDTTFYSPKEIYNNQKVVDNQRVLRQLSRGSDRLHQEMVNGQYKK